MSTTGDAARDGQRPDAAPPEESTSDERARLQRQARALGNPTRFAVFEHVARVHRPVQVAALVEQFGLNHNVIRQHLAKLCEADLFVEEFAPRNGPGRPALQYRLAPEVAGTWGISSPYEELASLLLEMTAEGLSPREVGVRAGRRAAAAATERASPLDRLVAELRRRGLQPRLVNNSTGAELVLASWPFAQVASAQREIVCEMHRGLAEGFLQELGSDLMVTGPQSEKPGATGCTIVLERSRSVAQ